MGADELVFITVVLVRLGVPLLIPRYALPAILAALVVDAADQTIFQAYTDLNLDGYQSYDKALDVYYLTIAYLATVKNWSDPLAFKTAQFLWYYRLVGVLLFELFEARALLLVFPNTFEYFFIFYEAVRTSWDPRRLTGRQVIGAAAAIWVFIKLPQEWWIHIAQRDVTDTLKEDILGVTVATPWGEALGQNLWFVGLVVALAAVAAIAVRAALPHLPPTDWRFTLDVDAHLDRPDVPERIVRIPVVSWYVAEKVALTTMIAVIFSQIIPGNEATPLQTAIGVGAVVVASAAVSQWLAARGTTWRSTATELTGMVVVNGALTIGYLAFLRSSDRPINEAATAFFVLLFTIVITLFDRFHRQRWATWGDRSPLARRRERLRPAEPVAG
ncbi:MAG: hypothetical protein S0880_15105 [Actinomycetota bacterium]|nr:hypothetical protein [Actinomycetota bacterium]